MAILLIISGIILLIVGMIIGLKGIKPFYFNLIAGFIVVIGTFFGLFGKMIQDKISADKTDKIIATGEMTNKSVERVKKQNENLTIKSDSMAKTIEKQALVIDSLRVENTDLHMKLAMVSNDIYQRITGGESYCVLEVFFMGEKGTPFFMLSHRGEIPLKNVQLSIEDLGRRVFLIETEANGDPSLPVVSEIIKKTHYDFSHPSIYPKTTITNIPIPIEEGQEDIRLDLWINLDNGSLHETLEVNSFRSNDEREYNLILKRGDEVIEKR